MYQEISIFQWNVAPDQLFRQRRNSYQREMVGKRKREAIVVSRSTEQEEAPAADPVDSHDLLRKYFEAQFEPLTTTQISAVSVSRTEFKEDESSDSEWDGISDGAEESYDEDDQAPEVTLEVVDHSTSHKMTRDELEKELRKQFMVRVWRFSTTR